MSSFTDGKCIMASVIMANVTLANVKQCLPKEDFVKFQRTWIRQPYIGWWTLNVENISKPLENMNIKFIHDITV